MMSGSGLARTGEATIVAVDGAGEATTVAEVGGGEATTVTVVGAGEAKRSRLGEPKRNGVGIVLFFLKFR